MAARCNVQYKPESVLKANTVEQN